MVGHVNDLQGISNFPANHESSEGDRVFVGKLRQALNFCPSVETAVIMWLQNIYHETFAFLPHDNEVRVERFLTTLFIRHTESPIPAGKVSQPADEVDLFLSPLHERPLPAIQIGGELALLCGKQMILPNVFAGFLNDAFIIG